ncbi:hypothetical protein FS837_006040, partial [Tulasnella sp. UAMH 9824]
IINHGASVGFHGPSALQSCSNLRSAFEVPESITVDIAALLSNGRAHGPFPSPPLPAFRCSPLGSVTHKRSSKHRRIHHLSWPEGSSVNDWIPDSEGSITYERFQHAVSAVRTLGRGSLLAKLDLKDAFRHIPVRPADWNLLGYSWQGQFYYDVVLTFGLKSTPYIFNLFAEALHWIISQHIPATLKHYLDDFLPVFSPSTPVHTANVAIEWIMGLGSTLGLSFQPEKMVWPTTRLEFLGLTLDTDRMEASLPPDKLDYLQEITSLWASRTRCTLRDLQKLMGFLQFASQVIPVSWAFIRHLIDFSATFTTPFQRRRVPAAARRDIWWWDHFASSWNGIQLIQPTRKTLYVYTDASGKKGMGGIFGNLWFSARVAQRYRHFDIQVKEIAAVLEAVLRWGSAFRSCHIIFHVDNEAIVSALRDSTIRSPMSMSILRMSLMLSASLDFTFSAGPPDSWYQTHAHVSRLVAFYLWHGLASSTRRTYSSGQKSFIDFAILNRLTNDDGSILPASQQAVMEWVAWLGARVQPKTIKAYLCHRLIRGIRWYHGEKDRKPRLPITMAVLIDLTAQLRPDAVPDDAVFDAAFKLTFAGFLRCGEFTVEKEGKFNPETDLTRRCI